MVRKCWWTWHACRVNSVAQESWVTISGPNFIGVNGVVQVAREVEIVQYILNTMTAFKMALIGFSPGHICFYFLLCCFYAGIVPMSWTLLLYPQHGRIDKALERETQEFNSISSSTLDLLCDFGQVISTTFFRWHSPTFLKYNTLQLKHKYVLQQKLPHCKEILMTLINSNICLWF